MLQRTFTLVRHRKPEYRPKNEAPMDDVELPDLAGKQIVSAKISQPSTQEQELSFEFQDGTSFSFSCISKITSEMSVYRGGVGEPEVIRKLALD
jgi:hypothetical protein